MIGLTRRVVTIRPLMMPQTTPARMPARMAINTLPVGRRPIEPTVPTPTSTEAATTEPTEAIEPTEMSSAPAMMTTVSPIASRPTTTTAWARLFMMFCQEKNLSPPPMPNQRLTTVISSTSTMSAKISERLSAPTKSTTRRKNPSRWGFAVDGVDTLALI